MNTVIQHESLGKISYEESFWTGKKSISINDVPATKISKNSFRTQDGKEIVISGNYLAGAQAIIRLGESNRCVVELLPKTKWYEITLSILPFLLILIWGNVPALCQIVPVVGGALGGFISALISCANLLIIKSIKQVWLKIIISIVALSLAFLICYFVALLILSFR